VKNSRIEARALDIVIAYEARCGRIARPSRRTGFDLESLGPGGPRHIEVKSSLGVVGRRWLERAQYLCIRTDPRFFVYTVNNVSSRPRILVFPRRMLLTCFLRQETKYWFDFHKNHQRES
jgi:hypothetical protein